MDTQVHTHIYIDTQTHKYADIHIYTLHTDTHTDTPMYGYTDTYKYIHTNTWTHRGMHINTKTHIDTRKTHIYI